MAALTWKPGDAGSGSAASFDGHGLAQHLANHLPAYAMPLFIRLREEQEVTGTFKYRKVELKTQAFNPAEVAEPLYVLLDRERGHERLTPEVYASVQRGGLRL